MWHHESNKNKTGEMERVNKKQIWKYNLRRGRKRDVVCEEDPEGVLKPYSIQKSYPSLFSVSLCWTLALMIGKERERVVVKIQVVAKCCEGDMLIKRVRSTAEKSCGKITEES